jgi:hypothetical protein
VISLRGDPQWLEPITFFKLDKFINMQFSVKPNPDTEDPAPPKEWSEISVSPRTYGARSPLCAPRRFLAAGASIA